MATSRQLRLQDRQAQLAQREQRLRNVLESGRIDTTANSQRERDIRNRLFNVQNRQARVGFRAGDNPLATPDMSTTEQDLLRRQYLNTRLIQNRNQLMDEVGAQRQRQLQAQIDRLQGRQGATTGALEALRGVPGAPPVPPQAPLIPLPPGEATGPTVPGGPTPTLDDLLKQYQTPNPMGTSELGNYYMQTLAGGGAPAGTDALNTFYQQGLSRLNANPQPSFEDQYSRWRDVATREADRQAAAINEAFGTRGARYGSDLLQAQGKLRSDLTTNLATQADTINSNINTQRLAELNAVTGGMNQVQQLEQQRRQAAATGMNQQQQLEQQRQDKAMAWLFADYLRRTGLPPGLAAGSQFFTSFGPPTTLVNQ